MNRLLLIAVFALLIGFEPKAQTVEVDGYVKDMQTFWNAKGMPSMSNNLIHNRLNFSAYFDKGFSFKAGMRNRLVWGDFLRIGSFLGDEYSFDYGKLLVDNSGFVNASWNVINQSPDYVLNTTFDRFYLDYSSGDWQVTIGRQRINWGMNLVWNPNDVFNAYSFFDFDYEERPGTDAVRVQYYTGTASSVEMVYKIAEKWDEMSLAGLWRVNAGGYDIQLLGGKMQSDFVVGAGWNGEFNGAGFRGEATLFHNEKSSEGKNTQLVSSISADYMFQNSVYCQLGVLYNSAGATDSVGTRSNYLLTTGLSAKNLSFARWSLFAQASYPLSPLLSADMAAIVNPLDGSFFVSPSLRYSLADNVEVNLMGQLFAGETATEFGGYGQLIHLRLKVSF